MFHDELRHEGKSCIRYEGIIGIDIRASKGNKGALSVAQTILVSIMILDKLLVYGINPYQIIKSHRSMCFNTKNKNDFFLAPKLKSKCPESFLRSTPIGHNMFRTY